MNQKEILLLTHFRKDARMSLTAISKKTKIPVSTVYDKLKRFEREIIDKHTSILDFKKLGYELKMSLLLKSDKVHKDELQDYLLSDAHTNSVQKINNGFDFIIECIFRNLNDFDSFLDDLEQFNVLEKKEYFILEDIKRGGFVPAIEL